MSTASRNALAAIILSFGAATATDAASTFHPADNEAGSVNHVVQGTHSRAQVEASERLANEQLDKHWSYTGGDAGWTLKQHAYELREGRVVHTDEFPHDTPRPEVPKGGAGLSAPDDLGG